MFKEKIVLITCGIGSLDQALTYRLLQNGVKIIRIFSRNENKQMLKEKI
jgi:FlaA1/EpsC-like NDP-sugar epimerase